MLLSAVMFTATYCSLMLHSSLHISCRQKPLTGSTECCVCCHVGSLLFSIFIWSCSCVVYVSIPCIIMLSALHAILQITLMRAFFLSVCYIGRSKVIFLFISAVKIEDFFLRLWRVNVAWVGRDENWLMYECGSCDCADNTAEKVPFSLIVERSLCMDSNTHAWCATCAQYERQVRCSSAMCVTPPLWVGWSVGSTVHCQYLLLFFDNVHG